MNPSLGSTGASAHILPGSVPVRVSLQGRKIDVEVSPQAKSWAANNGRVESNAGRPTAPIDRSLHDVTSSLPEYALLTPTDQPARTKHQECLLRRRYVGSSREPCGAFSVDFRAVRWPSPTSELCLVFSLSQLDDGPSPPVEVPMGRADTRTTPPVAVDQGRMSVTPDKHLETDVSSASNKPYPAIPKVGPDRCSRSDSYRIIFRLRGTVHNV